MRCGRIEKSLVNSAVAQTEQAPVHRLDVVARTVPCGWTSSVVACANVAWLQSAGTWRPPTNTGLCVKHLASYQLHDYIKTQSQLYIYIYINQSTDDLTLYLTSDAAEDSLLFFNGGTANSAHIGLPQERVGYNSSPMRCKASLSSPFRALSSTARRLAPGRARPPLTAHPPGC